MTDDTEPTAEIAPEPAPVPPRRRGTVLLGVTAALLLVVSVVLAVGYGRSRNELAARDRTLAARTAERDRLLAQLDEVRTRRADLETKLAAAQASALDPAGYEKIKKCVQAYAGMERDIQKIVKNGFPDGPPDGDHHFVTVPPNGSAQFVVPTTCIDAEPYLK